MKPGASIKIEIDNGLAQPMGNDLQPGKPWCGQFNANHPRMLARVVEFRWPEAAAYLIEVSVWVSMEVSVTPPPWLTMRTDLYLINTPGRSLQNAYEWTLPASGP